MSAPAHAVTGADPVGVVDPMPLGLGLGFATLLRDAAELLDEAPLTECCDGFAENYQCEPKHSAEYHCGWA